MSSIPAAKERLTNLAEGRSAATDIRGLRSDLDAILAELSRLEEENAKLRAEHDEALKIVRRFVTANDEAPEFGLADCIDNDGEHYQSADLAALIVEGRLALQGAQDDQ